MKNSVPFVAVILQLLLFTPVTAGDADISGRDVLCGPRCVQYLMEWICPERSVPLTELVTELQSTALGHEVSMLDLQRMLSAHGIETIAIKPGGQHALHSTMPAIVHQRTVDDGLGHFVVWHPASDRFRSVVWDGISGLKSEPAWKFHQSIDGGCLFVVPSSVHEPGTGQLLYSVEMIAFTGLLLMACGQAPFVWSIYRHRVRGGIVC